MDVPGKKISPLLWSLCDGGKQRSEEVAQKMEGILKMSRVRQEMEKSRDG